MKKGKTSSPIVAFEPETQIFCGDTSFRLIMLHLVKSLAYDFRTGASSGWAIQPMKPADQVRIAVDYFLINKTFGRVFIETMIQYGQVQNVICLVPFAIEYLDLNHQFQVLTSATCQISYQAMESYQFLIDERQYDSQKHLSLQVENLEISNIDPGLGCISRFLRNHQVKHISLTGIFGFEAGVIVEKHLTLGETFGDWTNVNIPHMTFNVKGCWFGALGPLPHVTFLEAYFSVFGSPKKSNKSRIEIAENPVHEPLSESLPNLKHFFAKGVKLVYLHSVRSNVIEEFKFGKFLAAHFSKSFEKLDVLELQHDHLSRFCFEFYPVTVDLGEEVDYWPKKLICGPSVVITAASCKSKKLDSLECSANLVHKGMNEIFEPKTFIPVFGSEIYDQPLPTRVFAELVEVTNNWRNLGQEFSYKPKLLLDDPSPSVKDARLYVEIVTNMA